MPSSGIKSIFVPTSLLREELPVGYDQAAGADDTDDTDAVQTPASTAPLFEQAPVAEAAEEETPAEAPEEEAPAEAEDQPAEAEDQPAETEDALAPEQTEDAPAETTEATPEPVTFSADPGDEPVAQSGGLVAAIESDMILPNLDQEGGFDFDDPDQTTQVGGFEAAEIMNAVQSIFVSATEATIADIAEDGVYHLSIIKGFLDSISRSLAAIASKYAGDQTDAGSPVAVKRPAPRPQPAAEAEAEPDQNSESAYASDVE